MYLQRFLLFISAFLGGARLRLFAGQHTAVVKTLYIYLMRGGRLKAGGEFDSGGGGGGGDCACASAWVNSGVDSRVSGGGKGG